METSTFFSHENQAAPPALSSGGKLRFGVKADLLRCLESNLPENKSVPEVDAVILDGAAVVQMLKPNTSRHSKSMEKLFLHHTSLLNLM